MRKLYYAPMVTGDGHKSLIVFTSQVDAKKYCDTYGIDFNHIKSSYCYAYPHVKNGVAKDNYSAYNLEIK